jgi:hypothetical protein
MKAIQVRYLPATERKPARLKASAHGIKSVTVSKEYGWRSHDNRSAEDVAVQALLDQNPQWKWTLADLAHGTLPNGDLAYVYNGSTWSNP